MAPLSLPLYYYDIYFFCFFKCKTTNCVCTRHVEKPRNKECKNIALDLNLNIHIDM